MTCTLTGTIIHYPNNLHASVMLIFCTAYYILTCIDFNCFYCILPFLCLLQTVNHKRIIIIIRLHRSCSAAAYSHQTFPWTFCRSVRVSLRLVHCGKTADRIWMPFGIVSWTGPVMRQVMGFGDWSMGRGTFGGQICDTPLSTGTYRAYVCYSAATRPSCQITLGRLVVVNECNQWSLTDNATLHCLKSCSRLSYFLCNSE